MLKFHRLEIATRFRALKFYIWVLEVSAPLRKVFVRTLELSICFSFFSWRKEFFFNVQSKLLDRYFADSSKLGVSRSSLHYVEDKGIEGYFQLSFSNQGGSQQLFALPQEHLFEIFNGGVVLELPPELIEHLLDPFFMVVHKVLANFHAVALQDILGFILMSVEEVYNAGFYPFENA